MSEVIAAMRSSHDRLSALAAGITPQVAAAPAYPTEWSIGKVLSHLGSGAQIATLILDAGLNGTEAPTRDAFRDIWAVWDAKSPWDMANDGIASDTAYVERLEALTPAELEQTRVMMFIGETDIDGMVRLRLSEHAVHTWDVAVALDPPATVGAEATPYVVDALARVVEWTGKPIGSEVTVHVATTEPARDFTLTLAEKASLTPGIPADAAASLALPAEAFIRLVYGRLDPDHTPTSVTASGVKLDDLRRAFPDYDDFVVAYLEQTRADAVVFGFGSQRAAGPKIRSVDG